VYNEGKLAEKELRISKQTLKKNIFRTKNSNKTHFRSCGGCVMPVNCELEPDALEKQLAAAKVKVLKTFHSLNPNNVQPNRTYICRNCHDKSYFVIYGRDLAFYLLPESIGYRL
jgi:hypothetical protein